MKKLFLLLQIEEPNVVLNNGNDTTANHANGLAAAVKVEEVDLDSDSEEMCTEKHQTGLENNNSASNLMDDTEYTQEEADEFQPPSLTLQSFARIPALATQDFNPHINHKTNTCLPVISEEHTCSQEMFQGI